MADYRDHRYPGRSESRGSEDLGDEEQHTHRHDVEHERKPSSGGFGRGSARDRMGSEQFRGQDEYGGFGERDYRDFGRGQPGGVYEHSGSRDYRHGGGYGGYGEAPGESGGGFGSGRSYAAEPGWGPDYGQQAGPHRGRDHGARGNGPQGGSQRRRQARGPKG